MHVACNIFYGFPIQVDIIR